jgi:hypothetical protein
MAWQDQNKPVKIVEENNEPTFVLNAAPQATQNIRQGGLSHFDNSAV